jgi:hypothetical protein
MGGMAAAAGDNAGLIPSPSGSGMFVSPSGRRISPSLNDAGVFPVAAASSSVSSQSKGVKCLIITMYILTVLLFAVVYGLFGTVVYFQANTLPRHTGSLSLPGLRSGSVSITREDNGIIHIDAKSEYDAFFAQGVVNAQDRLWQLEFQRRVGRGTLSAAVGNGALSVLLPVLFIGNLMCVIIMMIDNRRISLRAL